MKELIPGLGDRKARNRLDELFNRQTLGSVMFGSHLNKIFEKLYNLIALTIILTVLGVNVYTSLLVSAGLFLVWVLGTVVVVYVFIQWESVMETVDDVKETAEETLDTDGDGE